jgi:hypothetical protein
MQNLVFVLLVQMAQNVHWLPAEQFVSVVLAYLCFGFLPSWRLDEGS